jgi:hypothetical protein
MSLDNANYVTDEKILMSDRKLPGSTEARSEYSNSFGQGRLSSSREEAAVVSVFGETSHSSGSLCSNGADTETMETNG